MQASHLNKIIFYLIFCFGFGQHAYCQIDTKEIHKADLLFKSNRLLEAEKIYLLNLASGSQESENIKYKLAFIAKEKNDWITELTYLSSIQAQNATPEIAKRIAEIGEKQQVQGFQINFLNQVQWLYFAFFPYIIGFLLLLAAYSFLILLNKKRKNRHIKPSYITYLALFLIGMLILTNYPNFLNFGIIKKDKVFLREFSSSAAPVKIILKKGNIISHWNEQEVWANCYFDGQFGYIKTDDFQGIN